MKTILTGFAIFLFWLALIFAFEGFVLNEYNPSCWSVSQRGFFAYLGGFVGIMLCAAYALFKFEKND